MTSGLCSLRSFGLFASPGLFPRGAADADAAGDEGPHQQPQTLAMSGSNWESRNFRASFSPFSRTIWENS